MVKIIKTRKSDGKKNPFNFPVRAWNEAFSPAEFRFVDREFFIISYETDEKFLESLLPPGVELLEPIVKYEFIRMPDSSGFGDYTETGQVVPVKYKGEEGTFTLSMYLDCHAPIAAGREIWGFPKKYAKPVLSVDSDTLLGTLDYGSVRVATATMAYKAEPLDLKIVLATLKKPVFLLKNIPGVDGKTPEVCQLTRTYLKDINLKGAWTGPAALELHPHALAPVADLPVKKVVSCAHIITDLTLPYGEVVRDYLKK